MAGTAPTPILATHADGRLITADDLNGVSAHVNRLLGIGLGGRRAKKPMCVLKLAGTTFTAAANTLYTVPWARVLDTDSMWDSGTPSQATIRTAGWYRIDQQLHWDRSTGGIRSCKILLNGTNHATNAVAGDNRAPVTATEADGTTLHCSALIRVAVGAVIYGGILQSSNNPVTLTSSFGGCTQALEWVAPYNA